MGRELAALRMPDQFLGRQPAHALDERALDLPDVDGRIQRPAGIVEDVGAQQFPFAGERVDDHLAHRGAVGEVEERMALQRVAVPAQTGRGVETVRPELDAVEIRLADDGAEGQRATGDLDLVVGEAHVGRFAAVACGGTGGQTFADLPRRVLRGLAVEVGTGRSGGGGGVGDLGGVGGRHAHALEAHAQFVRHHLRDLGVEPLAHLGAAVVHQDRAVVVHMDQRAGLVEMLDVERDAELQRRQRDAALEHRAGRIEACDGLAPRAVVARRFELGDQLVDDVVAHHLRIRRDVAFCLAVEVDAPHIERIAAQLARNRVEDVLDRDRALRSAEAAERRVALRVRLAGEAVQRHFRQPVGVVEVAQRAGHHRTRQVGRMPGARHHRDFSAEDAALVVVADLVVVPEAVAPAGDHEVVVAVQPQLDRSPQPRSCHCRHAGEDRRLRFLAAETAAHAPAFDMHFVGLQMQRMRDQVLHLARMLRRAVHMHAAALFRDRVADLPFEIELLLTADVERVFQSAWRCGDGCAHCGLFGIAVVGVASRAGAAHQMHRRHDVLAACVGILRRENGCGGVDGDDVFRKCRRTARGVAAFGDDGEQRLAEIANLAGAEDRVVVNDRAAVVAAGNVLGRQHGDDARHGADAVEVHRGQPSGRHRRQAERAMQRSLQFGQVVDVVRLAGDVQRCGFMRPADADAHALLLRERFGIDVDAGGSVDPVIGKGAGSGRFQKAGVGFVQGLVHLRHLRSVLAEPHGASHAASRSRHWSLRAATDRPRASPATGAATGSAPPAGGTRRRRACPTAA